jgi:hypothetical protein
VVWAGGDGMNEQRPDPLVPAEVDLRDFAFMPLDVGRLRDSDLASEETPEACWAAVLLWCAAWHQVPAGSIPDSDDWQAKHAGYKSQGRIAPGWRKVRTGALRGWVACSDGRLYHPVIAEKAIDAWRSKLKQRWFTECGRIKKHNQRHSMSLPLPEFEAWLSLGCPQGQPLPVPGDIPPTSPGSPGETHSKGQGEGQGQGQGNSLNTKPASQAPDLPPEDRPQLALVGGPQPVPPGPYTPPDCPHQAVLALWAQVLPEMPQHLATQWRGTRADHLRARWRETAVEKRWATEADGLAYFRRLFAYVGKSAFLTGKAKAAGDRRPFVVELAWLVNPTNWGKTLEGKFHQDAA